MNTFVCVKTREIGKLLLTHVALVCHTVITTIMCSKINRRGKLFITLIAFVELNVGKKLRGRNALSRDAFFFIKFFP